MFNNLLTGLLMKEPLMRLITSPKLIMQKKNFSQRSKSALCIIIGFFILLPFPGSIFPVSSSKLNTIAESTSSNLNGLSVPIFVWGESLNAISNTTIDNTQIYALMKNLILPHDRGKPAITIVHPENKTYNI